MLFPLLGLTLAFSAPLSADPALTGTLYEKIDGTGLAGLFMPSIGLSASPSSDGNEIGDSFAEFKDPGAAMAQLEALKRQHGFSGGRVFVGFTYDSDVSGKLDFVCGVSPSRSHDYDDIRARMVESNHGDSMDYRQFKLGSRSERVRAIARCLAGLPGMPPLRPTHPDIRKLYIDDASYRLGERWLRGMDPQAVQGSSEQYRKAFFCLVTESAREMPEATGESVVFRAIAGTSMQSVTVRTPAWERQLLPGVSSESTEKRETTFSLVFMSVLNDRAARATWSESDPERLTGLWPGRIGTPGFVVDGVSDPIEQALGPSARKWLPTCRRHAGLFELPPARVPDPAPEAHCSN